MFYFVFFCLFSLTLFANPAGHKVVNGKVKIDTIENKLKVTASDKAIIHWQDFSINKGEITEFIQPSNKAVLLNRVTGKELSKIYGRLEANGKIYLINPQGILIGDSGIIDTNGFVGTTLEFSNENFLKGNHLFLESNHKNSIVNLGKIIAKDGSVYLLGYEVKNAGTIEAKKHTAGLAAANELILQPEGNNKIFIKVNKKCLGTLENSGKIEAFKVELQGCTNPFNYAIKNSGEILSSKVEKKNGEIYIKSYQGKIAIDGMLESDCGQTIIEGKGLKIGENAKIQDISSGKIHLNIQENRLINYGSIKTNGGDIQIDSEKSLLNMGSLDCTADTGGKITIKTNWYTNHGKIVAEGVIKGGSIDIHAEKNITETASALTSVNAKNQAGTIALTTGESGRLFSSGVHDASANQGGQIHFSSYEITLPGASILADGKIIKGEISLGKVKYSANNIKLLNAASPTKKDNISINPFTKLVAGKVKTALSDDSLNNKALLGSSCDISGQVELKDPNGGTGALFGDSIEVLANGNIIVTKPDDDTDSDLQTGAFHLYNGSTAKLISTIRGETPGDRIGSGGIIVLEGNNNFVVSSPEWQSSPGATAGAVTWANGTNGVSGLVNTSNSLYGTYAGDRIAALGQSIYGQTSFLGITALKNGNYVVSSPYWNNNTSQGAYGASTWMNGINGKDGNNQGPGVPVSTLNSLYGSIQSDKVGFVNSEGLINNNYVVLSPFWNGAGLTGGGAATLINGDTAKDLNGMGPGVAVSTINSLYGSHYNDGVGIRVASLTTGKYVISSFDWNGLTGAGGAVTLMDGASGTDVTGAGPGVAVSTINSLYGTSVDDNVGFRIEGLTGTGNYVVLSSYWNGVTGSGGAVTLMDGNTGIDARGNGPSIAVSTLNSLYGTSLNDHIGGKPGGHASIIELTNGKYVIASPFWDGVVTDGGAVTLIDGASGTDANGGGPGVAVSTLNSLYGTNMDDMIGYGSKGSIVPLTNDNYIVLSTYWDGVATNGGAVTLINGNTGKDANGILGPGVAISTINSLYADTNKGGYFTGAVALATGNYVVLSPYWTRPSGYHNGAATLINGTSGTDIFGNGPGFTVNTSNSLYGSPFSFTGLNGSPYSTQDLLTLPGGYALKGGNYLVLTGNWFTTGYAYGAATCGDGNVGITGFITTTNSIYGELGSPGPNFNRIIARDNSEPFINSPFVVSFPQRKTGIVIISALGILTPVPPSPGGVPANQKNKALYAFYRSIADSEMGQRWNFWPGVDISDPLKIDYITETVIRHINQGPFFPHYQERGPFKYDAP